MLNSNEPIKVAHLQKLANQSMLNGALVLEIVNNSFSECKKNFGRLIKQEKFLIQKNRDNGQPRIYSYLTLLNREFVLNLL